MKKDLFLKVINNNLLLRSIFKYVHWIHKDIEQYRDTTQLPHNIRQIYKYNELLERPDIAAIYNYFDLITQFCNIKKDVLLESEDNDDRKEYFKLLCRAAINSAKFNHLDLLKNLIEKRKKKNSSDSNNNDDYNKYIIPPKEFSKYFNYFFFKGDLMFHAAHSGSKSVIDYLDWNSNNDEFKWRYNQAFLESLLSGDLELCKWFSKKVFVHVTKDADYKSIRKINIRTLYYNAARSGNVELLQWLIDEFTEQRLTEFNVDLNDMAYQLWREATASCNVDMLNYLYNKNQVIQQQMYSISLIENLSIYYNYSHKVVDWLLSKGVSFNVSTLFSYAIRSQKGVEIIKWFHQHLPNFTHTSSMLDKEEIIYEYHPDPFQWFFINFSKQESNIMDFCISSRNLDIIKWIHESSTIGGSPNSLDILIDYKDIEILKWFTANRTEGLSSRRMNTLLYTLYGEISYKFENEEPIKWILQNRTEEFTENILDSIFMTNCKESKRLALWLVQNYHTGCTQKSMDNVLKFNSEEYLDWFHKNIPNPGCSVKAVNDAISNNHINSVKWIHEHCPSVIQISKYMSFVVLKNNNLTMAQWLFKNYRSKFWSKRFKLKLFKNDKTFSKETKKFIIYNLPNQLPYDILNYYKNDREIYNHIKNNYPLYSRNLK